MDKFEIPFINLCIQKFASRFGLTRKSAYNYLEKYKGLAFMIEFYDVEHLQSIDETIDDLVLKCKNEGGYLS